MSDDIKEIQDHLQVDPEQIALEPIIEPESSPLNQPVAENEIGLNSGSSASANTTGDQPPQPGLPGNDNNEPPPDLNAYDAPEQELGSNDGGGGEGSGGGHEPGSGSTDFEVPDVVAEQSADTMIHMANTVLEIGSGFFITLRKRKEFFEFEEIIEVIDEHNAKKIERFKLSEEEKATLRPVLIQVIKESGKTMSPTNQLIALGVAIMAKRARYIMEDFQENRILEERIIEIIQGKHQEEEPETVTEPEPQEEEVTEYEGPEIPFSKRHEHARPNNQPNEAMPEEVLELEEVVEETS